MRRTAVWLEPNERSVGRFEYGSLLNLPRASSSIDAAIWVSREVEPDIAPFALREIFRVLKPGGELVFVAVGNRQVWTCASALGGSNRL